MEGVTFSAPVPLLIEHNVSQFTCGELSLDNWLRDRALKNEISGATRTYVVCSKCGNVAGYYSLAIGNIEHKFMPGSIKRNMPQPIPAMLLARLAVDLRYINQSIGTSMLQDAIMRTFRVADIAGVRMLLVHALHERAATFYCKRGFVVSPFDPLILYLVLNNAYSNKVC